MGTLLPRYVASYLSNLVSSSLVTELETLSHQLCYSAAIVYAIFLGFCGCQVRPLSSLMPAMILISVRLSAHYERTETQGRNTLVTR